MWDRTLRYFLVLYSAFVMCVPPKVLPLPGGWFVTDRYGLENTSEKSDLVTDAVRVCTTRESSTFNNRDRW